MLTALLCWWSRAEILSVIACAANTRRPLPEALRDIGDRRLTALAEDLAQGYPLGRSLARCAIIAPWTARALDSRSDQARQLRQLADAAVAGQHRLFLLRWFPLALLAAVLVPMVMVQAFLDVTAPSLAASLVKEFGTAPQPIDMFFLDPWWKWQSWICFLALAAYAIVIAGLRQVAAVRHLTHLWWPEIHRQFFLHRLIHAVGPSEAESPRLNFIQESLTAIGMGIHRRQRPWWWADWKAWLTLTRFRLARSDRRGLAGIEGLSPRLHILAILDADGIDAAAQRVHADLERAVHHAWPVANALFWAAAVFGIILGIWGDFRILFTIIQAISSGGFV